MASSNVPPAIELTKSAKARWKKLADDPQRIEQTKQAAKDSVSFFSGAPSAVKHGERIRAPGSVDIPDEEDHGAGVDLDVTEGRTTTLSGSIEKDNVIPESSIQCPLCQTDPSVTEHERKRVYTLSRLDIHIKTDFHDRKPELQRAWDRVKEATGSDTVTCACCRASITGKMEYIKHMECAHPEQMW